MNKADVVIGVTGLNATDNPGPGISVIRSLRHDPEFKGKIIGLSYDALDPGNFSDYADAVYLIPYPSEGEDALKNRIKYIINQTGMQICIPTLDSELPGFNAISDNLEEAGCKMFLPTKDQYEMRSKTKLPELGAAAKIRVPAQCVIASIDDVYKLHEQFTFPLVIKGVFYGAEICHSVEDASIAYNKMVAQWGVPIIVQEFISGTEFDVVAVGDGKGGLVGAVPMKKMYMTDKGKGWSGIVVKGDELMEMTNKFMKATKWRGPCELEILRTTTGEHLLLEVNPRFPAWTFLSAGAGVNLSMAVSQLAFGSDPDVMPAPDAGTMFVRISLDQITHVDQFQHIVASGECHGMEPK
ncbi:MAG: biotin carboxylase [bacterium]|nr:biotin carboxylase [bacterium]MCP4798689.1 biotin carboxylase [bacterium]